jgi:hypothetical protein
VEHRPIEKAQHDTIDVVVLLIYHIPDLDVHNVGYHENTSQQDLECIPNGTFLLEHLIGLYLDSIIDEYNIREHSKLFLTLRGLGG